MAAEKKVATEATSTGAVKTNGESLARSESATASVTKPWTSQKPRVSVAKAYKMFVGGAFIRSESGRYFQVEAQTDADDANPEIVNQAFYTEGWMLKLKLANPADAGALLSPEDYGKVIG